MPEAFERCRRNGGKIRRVSGPSEEHNLGEDEYVNYCVDDDGTSHRGYVHKKGEGGGEEEGGQGGGAYE